MAEKIDILGLTSDELAGLARGRLTAGAGIATALYRDAFARGVFEPEALGAGADSAGAWRETFSFSLPRVVHTVEETLPDGRSTRKAVLSLADGLEIECVSIPMAGDRFTLCVSSQVGCKMACTFCETGRMGLHRNLSAGEIVAQIVTARAVLGWRVESVVFMGMGEPLDNAGEVIRSMRVMTDRRGVALGQRRLTVCTVGHAAGIERLIGLGWKRLNVSISLNSPFDHKRSELMPINRKTPLAELVALLQKYPRRRNFAFAVNYCLMPGINDSREDATATAEICKSLGRALVHLIPYNPGTAPLTRAPDEEEIERFIAWLKEDGASVARRITKGRTVMAACGQLGNVDLRRSRGPRRQLVE